MKSQKQRRRDTVNLRLILRGELERHCPRCEVPGCGRKMTDMHHMQNRGMGLKDDVYENMMALCHEHHMELEGTGKETWARKHFWTANYQQVVAYTALRRRLERRGDGSLHARDIPFREMSDDVLDVALLWWDAQKALTEVSDA